MLKSIIEVRLMNKLHMYTITCVTAELFLMRLFVQSHGAEIYGEYWPSGRDLQHLHPVTISKCLASARHQMSIFLTN